MTVRSRAAAGWTLVELTVVLLVAGLLIGLAGRAYLNADPVVDRQDARAHAGQIVAAIDAFALSRGRLPCPDMNGNARENPCGGDAALRSGWVPYESLDLAVPSAARRSWYAVYRGTAGDLASSEDVTGNGRVDRGDLVRKLAALSASTVVESDQVHLTGDGGARGQVDCDANRVVNPAYAVTVPRKDRDQNGNRFDSPHEPGLCAYSPNTPESPRRDDVVQARGADELAGWLRRQ